MSQHIVILMATYRGAAHLPRQLASIAAQSHADWSLIVSDDGSDDDTVAIVREFARSRPDGQVRLRRGPRKGATANFLSMLAEVPEGAAMAFCDQDDHWFPDKLTRALPHVADVGPVHYAARTVITDQNLHPLTGSRHFRRPLGFRNALVQAIMAGNASVFSPRAVELLQLAAPAAIRAQVLSHDWWAYQITSGAGATLVHDPRPCLLYRQHGRSEVGRNDTPQAMAVRLRKLMAGDYGKWLRSNQAALAPVADLLTIPNRQVFDRFTDALDASGPRCAAMLRQAGLYRQTAAGTTALFLSAAAGSWR
ncbi:glycosyltransferase [Paracoccus sp. 1_MG-2023]|uniref:glycosyltransferase n=1 Tax=unclassified Paracoccus (in: a-proteobacteria) TaxID=2688777 RepID=UPI001C0852E8|nr:MULTISPECIES: glycosyltransferase [unclassified Paracoccus (in: a-proteobacteria)]MBU2956885.1 glycosyltransferase [Paracoccus sp. C2R09]MDO6668083.1 glycosyltransferase [Paracoccus sp. 1_MG-2023]